MPSEVSAVLDTVAATVTLWPDPPGVGARLAEDAAKYLDEYVSHEFRTLDPGEQEAVVAILADALMRRSANRRDFLVAAMRGNDEMRGLLADDKTAGQLALISDDGVAFFKGLLTRTCELIQNWIRSPDLQGPATQEGVVEILKSEAALTARIESVPSELKEAVEQLEVVTEEVRHIPLTRVGDWLSVEGMTAGYRRTILGLAPNPLLNREAELSEMARFCGGDEDMWWGWQGDPWAGKTALMASFALDPRAGTRVVAFFVIGHQETENSRESFLRRAIAQLAEIVDDREIAYPTSAASQIDLFNAYLARAADACGRNGGRLVLLVDGLDEDSALTHSAGASSSIAGALPVRLPEHVRVVVAARPNPPLPTDLPDNHPLRSHVHWHQLESVPDASAARVAAETDLRDLLRTPLGLDLAAFVAAAGAPLTISDLAELTGTSAFDVDELLSGRAARSFVKVQEDGHSRHLAGYRLGHDRLDELLINMINPRGQLNQQAVDVGEEWRRWNASRERALRTWRTRICGWAAEWARRGWPEDTPSYLLGPAYPALLQLGGESDHELVTTVTHPQRIGRLSDLHRADSPAIEQIRMAVRHILGAPDADSAPNLELLGSLLASHDRLTRKYADLPEGLPAVLAGLGQSRRAVHLARAIQDPVRRAHAFTKLAAALTEPPERDLASASFEEARLSASQIADDSHFTRVRVLADVARTLLAAGRSPQSLAIAQESLIAAGMDPYDPNRASALADVSTTLIEAGAADEVQAAANTIKYFPAHERVSLDLAIWRIGQSHYSSSETATITASVIDSCVRLYQDPSQQILVLARIANALRYAPDLHDGILRAAYSARSQVLHGAHDMVGEADALSELAASFSACGRSDLASRIVEDVVAAGRVPVAAIGLLASVYETPQIESWAERAAAVHPTQGSIFEIGQVAELAAALSERGCCPSVGRHAALRARSLAEEHLSWLRRQLNPKRWIDAKAELARVFAVSGDRDRAIQIAEEALADASHPKPSEQALNLARAARALADRSDRDHSELCAARAMALVDGVESRVRAQVLEIVAPVLAISSHPENARKALDEIANLHHEALARTLLAVAAACAAANDLDQAKSFANQAADLLRAKNNHDLAPVLAGIRARIGDTQQALSIMDDISVPSLRTASLVEIACGSVSRKPPDHDLAMLATEMAFASLGRCSLLDQASALVALADVLAAMNRPEQAQDALTRAREAANSAVRAEVEQRNAYSRIGRPVFHSGPRTRPDSTDEALARAANILAQIPSAGYEAQAALASIVFTDYKLEASAEVVVALTAAGARGVALDVARHVLVEAGRLATPDRRSRALIHAADALCSVGELRGAARALGAAWTDAGGPWAGWWTLAAVNPESVSRLVGLLADDILPVSGSVKVK